MQIDIVDELVPDEEDFDKEIRGIITEFAPLLDKLAIIEANEKEATFTDKVQALTEKHAWLLEELKDK
jgi:hypothetical protein